MDTVSTFLDYLKDPATPFGMFDLVYAIFLLYGLIRGMFRGLPEELSQLLGTVLVFVGAMKFYQPLSDFMMEHTRLEDPTASLVLSYLLIFLTLMIVWKLITFVIRKALDWSCPKQLKGLGGGAVGLIKNALLIVVVLVAVLISGHQVLRESMIENSWTGTQVLRVLPAAVRGQESVPAKEAEPDGSGDA